MAQSNEVLKCLEEALNFVRKWQRYTDKDGNSPVQVSIHQDGDDAIDQSCSFTLVENSHGLEVHTEQKVWSLRLTEGATAYEGDYTFEFMIPNCNQAIILQFALATPE